MVRASSQIKKELSLLQQRTQELEASLDPLYEGYLKALSEASSRQLVMAAYHICTQAYPGKFLALSLQQRNQLQQEIQSLSQGLYRQFIAQREQAKKASRRPQKNSGLAFLQRLLEAKSSGAAIIATDGSRDSLLEKLSSLRLLDDDGDEASDGDSDSDWADDVPTAEDDGLDAWDRAESVDSEAEGGQQKGGDASERDRGAFSDRVGDRTDDRTDESEGDRPLESLTENIDIFASGFDRDTADSNEALGEDSAADSRPVGERDRDENDRSDRPDDLDFEIEVPPADERLTLTDEDDLLSALEGLARRSAEAEESTEAEEPLAPVHLVRQQMLLEKAIRKVFEQVSEQANEQLQQAEVMPSFPKALISAASGSGEIGEPMNSVPNVFKVSVRVMHGEAMMEAADEELRQSSERPRQRTQSKESDRRRRPRGPRPRSRSGPRAEAYSGLQEIVEVDTLPELSMISMQLSEVEFSDHTVSAWRSRIRQEFENLKKLGSRYQQTQRALETAQAEDAWRASWTVRAEDSDRGSSGEEI